MAGRAGAEERGGRVTRVSDYKVNGLFIPRNPLLRPFTLITSLFIIY